MRLDALRGTQGFALLVLVVVVAVVAYLIATDAFSLNDGDDADRIALAGVESEPATETTASSSAGLDSDGQTAGESGTDAAVGQAAVALDDVFQFGALRVRVTEFRFAGSVGTETDDTAARGRFAVVSLTVRNTGPEPLMLADRLRVIDSRARAFIPDADATAVAARRDERRADGLALALQPGITVDLVVVFDVAEDTADLQLRISGGFIDVELGP